MPKTILKIFCNVFLRDSAKSVFLFGCDLAFKMGLLSEHSSWKVNFVIWSHWLVEAESTNLRGRINVQLTFYLFCLDSAALNFNYLVEAKPVKQEVSCTVIPCWWVFSGWSYRHLDSLPSFAIVDFVHQLSTKYKVPP